jgi:ectoine hydroxylase-related dioxygenase (phytanoyl-CoA dioxygenase family)
MDVPIDKSNNCIGPAWVAGQQWTPVELCAGELLVFGSYLAHRSGPNMSEFLRKAIYATYNCKSEGSLHDAYYDDRAKLWPPTHKRRGGGKV